MLRFRLIVAITTLAAASAVSLAQNNQHVDHHPGSTASATAPSVGEAKDRTVPDMAMMDKHMKAMQAMHEKMARAKTPAEREALMAQHMKLMQEGMSMMGGMAPGAIPSDVTVRQQMLEKRMDMMQSMMQMMIDRMSVSPAARAK